GAVNGHGARDLPPRRSKVVGPSRQVVKATAARSQVRLSEGWTAGTGKAPLVFRPLAPPLPLRPVVPLVVSVIYGLSPKCFVGTVVVAVHGVHGDEACGDPMSSCHVPVVPRRVGCCGPSWSNRPPPGDADVCQ